MMDSNTYCIIMAGGVGNRFWPISNEQQPKQFIDILGTGKTFIRQTYERIASLFDTSNIYIITSERYVDITHQQIPELPLCNIIQEPYARNTATCIAYSAYKINGINPQAKMVILPSDHFISNEEAYLNDIKNGVDFIDNMGGLLTIGITPCRVETQYGYIQIRKEKVWKDIYDAKTFTEKPNEEMAKFFYESKEFLWNAGIFIWKASDIIEEYKNYMYDIYALFSTNSKLNTPDEKSFIDKIYGQCHNISIDTGIMEKSPNVYVMKGHFGWSDVGTWHAYRALCTKDENGNVVNTDSIILNDASNCIVNTPTGKRVIIQGVSNIIVAEKGEYLMICNNSDEEKIKRFEKQFRK